MIDKGWRMREVDNIKIESGKYRLVLQTNGELNIFRHDELWEINPLYSKMLIPMMYELIDSRNLLNELAARGDHATAYKVSEHFNKYGVGKNSDISIISSEAKDIIVQIS